MKIKAIIVGFLISVTLVVSAFAGWGQHHGDSGICENRVIEKLTQKLSLNEGQVEKLKFATLETTKVKKNMKENRKQVLGSIGEMLDQPTLDQERAISILKNKTQNMNEKAPQVVAALAGFYDSLTPEQQKILRDKFNKKMEHKSYSWK